MRSCKFEELDPEAKRELSRKGINSSTAKDGDRQRRKIISYAMGVAYQEQKKMSEIYFGGLSVGLGRTYRYTSSPERAITKLLDPPIKNGLTHCFQELTRILDYGRNVQELTTKAPPLRDVEKVSSSTILITVPYCLLVSRSPQKSERTS